jgi:GYF domain 2
MEIHILRDGKQIGPFTEETVQSLLKQGNILINDLAWAPGLNGWSPLHAVLYPAAQPPPTSANTVPPPMPPPVATSDPVEEPPVTASQAQAPADEITAEEAATPRQKAFLTFMAVPFSSELSRDRAAHLVNDAMENPKNSGRLKRWDEERLRLYPDLFADEIKSRRENRAQQFLEICEGEGGEFFEGVTKAHTQVLVGFLDVQYPTWDQSEHSAKFDYFFPAIAEKFPQLVKRSAKGRFKYPDGPKVAAELVRRPAAVRATPRSSPVKAIVRGIVWGGVLLAVAVGAVEFRRRGGIQATKAWIAKVQASAKTAPQKSVESKPAATTTAPVTATATPAPVAVRPIQPAQPTTTVAHTSPPVQVAPPTALSPQPVPPTPTPATKAPADPTMTASAAPSPTLPANVSLFDTTPPPAVPPASDPISPPAATPAPPPATPQRVFAKITKPTVISLRFGTSTLRPGTPVQVLSASGTNLTIKFGPETATIPTANTDYSETLSIVPGP